jgi:hypothetical protein
VRRFGVFKVQNEYCLEFELGGTGLTAESTMSVSICRLNQFKIVLCKLNAAGCGQNWTVYSHRRICCCMENTMAGLKCTNMHTSNWFYNRLYSVKRERTRVFTLE